MKIKVIKVCSCIMILTMLVIATKLYVVSNNTDNSEELSANEIQQLRKEYPLIDDSLSTVDYIELELDKVTESAETVVDATIVKELDSKKITLYKNDWYTLYRYEAKINEVITNDDSFKKKQGDTFILVLQDFNIDVFPEIKPGLQGIFPLFDCGSEEEEEYTFYYPTFYYVKDSNYVLSAFKEDADYQYTGKKSNKLIKSLKSFQ